jgi:hypothetical protein
VVEQPFAPLPRRRRVPVWAWVVGGCGAILVLSLVLVVVGAFVLARNFQSGGLSCLPKDFPVYAGASYQNVRTFVGTGGSSCTVTLDVAAPSSNVTAYYEQHLNSGSWKVKGYDAGQGVLGFGRSDNPRASGTVTFLGHGTRTQVDVQYDY